MTTSIPSKINKPSKVLESRLEKECAKLDAVLESKEADIGLKEDLKETFGTDLDYNEI